MAHEHPPLDFPLFGLQPTWHGPRWLDFIEGQAGDPVVGAWLGHGDDSRRPSLGSWALVGTFSRQHVAAGWLGPDETFEHYLVRRTAMLAMDSGPLLDHLLSTPDEWETWDTDTLTVGTQTLSARTTSNHAGVRTVLSLDLPGVGLIVHSRGLRGSDLSLSKVSDYRSYHFDPAVPLAYPAVLTGSIEAALGTAPD